VFSDFQEFVLLPPVSNPMRPTQSQRQKGSQRGFIAVGHSGGCPLTETLSLEAAKQGFNLPAQGNTEVLPTL
jgi:hypothetical protein